MELIVIIIILGIISATAVSKYLDIRAQARQAAARGVMGALASADTILYVSYIVNGSTVNYTLSNVLANANITGGAIVTAAAAQGTIAVGGGTYTFTYTAAGTQSPGQYTPNGF
jgi:MSHA pilin protein MshA